MCARVQKQIHCSIDSHRTANWNNINQKSMECQYFCWKLFPISFNNTQEKFWQFFQPQRKTWWFFESLKTYTWTKAGKKRNARIFLFTVEKTARWGFYSELFLPLTLARSILISTPDKGHSDHKIVVHSLKIQNRVLWGEEKNKNSDLPSAPSYFYEVFFFNDRSMWW